MPSCQTSRLQFTSPELTGSWLLGTNLDLAALPGAVPCARLHVRLVLAEWGLARLAEDAEVVTAELMTNAIEHAGGRYVRLLLRSDGEAACILVWDESFVAPVPVTDDEPDSPSGRGLVIVSALSQRWGYYRNGDGKFVWAVLA
jgi:anti-sigma regulatory factor (Ser/Thr protein kinase)